MNFYKIVLFGYLLLAVCLTYIILRDRSRVGTFCNKHKNYALAEVLFLFFTAMIAFDTHFIEPWTLKTTDVTVAMDNITIPIKIAFISDIQVGNHKNEKWVEKIVQRVIQESPDLVILGGDQIDNEAYLRDEAKELDPLKTLSDKYLTYAVIGNHEYGIGSATRENTAWQTGDRSADTLAELKKINIKILRSDLDCPKIKGQTICLFGIDDIWKTPQPDFSKLQKFNPTTTIIFITHNPDGILTWPTNIQKPELVLSGHTHGGQIWLPFIGPLGSAGIQLPNKFYRGLNYYHNIPIYTSTGAGESGGAVRFWNLPEIAIITIDKNQNKE